MAKSSPVKEKDQDARARGRGSRKPLRLSDLPWLKIGAFLGFIGAVAIVAYTQLDIDEVHRRAADFNPWVAFALLLVLPMVGFPASILHVAAGIRFGAGLGLAIVSLSIVIHIIASYTIVRLWRKHFENARWVQKVRDRIPNGAHASVCVFTVLLPGAPYSAVNYVLPLVGIPLRTLLFCAWPLHTLRSTITVVLGDQSDQLTVGRLAVLVGYALMILGASWWTYRRLRSQFEDPPPEASGQKQPA